MSFPPNILRRRPAIGFATVLERSRLLWSLAIAALLTIYTVALFADVSDLNRIDVNVTAVGLLFYTNFFLFMAVFSPRTKLCLMMFWAYAAVFMLPSALVNVTSNYFFWPAALGYDDTHYLKTFAIIFLFFVSFQIAYVVPARGARLPVTPPMPALTIGTGIVVFLAIGLSVAAIAILGLGAFFNARSLFETDLLDRGTSVASGLFSNLPKGVTLAALLCCFNLVMVRHHLDTRTRGLIYLALVLLVPLSVIVNFPGSAARSWSAVFVFAIVSLVFPLKNPRRRLAIILVLFVSAMTLYPIVAQIQRGSSEGYNFALELPNLKEYIVTGDFDGFQTILNTVIYADYTGFTGGSQLLSSLFFFVPRALWESKSEATSILVSGFFGYPFVNLSCPLPAEGYADFGYAGTVVYAVLFARLLKALDRTYARFAEEGDRSGSHLVACAIAGLLILVFRGPLLGIISFVVPCPIALLVAQWRLSGRGYRP